jgi:hypothetical protein
MIIFYVLFILLVIIIFFILYYECIIHNDNNQNIVEKKVIYDPNEYPELKHLIKNMKSDLSTIQQESIDTLQKKPQFLERRKEGVWVGDASKEYVEKLKNMDGWIHGWTKDDDWLNYPIMYDGELFEYAKKSLPTLCKHLQKISHCVYIAGLSVLKPKGRIHAHTDDDQTYDKGTLNYHFNINCPKQGQSIITIDNNNIIQKTGNSLLFDAGNTHSVYNNSSENRIILFMDFRHAKSKF